MNERAFLPKGVFWNVAKVKGFQPISKGKQRDFLLLLYPIYSIIIERKTE